MRNRNQEKAESLGYSVFYQHQGFDDGSMLTICYLSKDELPVSMGFSMCSPLEGLYDVERKTIDFAAKKGGRVRSCGRALKAAMMEQNYHPIVRDANDNRLMPKALAWVLKKSGYRAKYIAGSYPVNGVRI